MAITIATTSRHPQPFFKQFFLPITIVPFFYDELHHLYSLIVSYSFQMLFHGVKIRLFFHNTNFFCEIISTYYNYNTFITRLTQEHCKNIAPRAPKHCSQSVKAMLPERQSIALRVPKHCSQSAKALLSERQSIAPRVSKHSSWSVKALLPERQSIAFGT